MSDTTPPPVPDPHRAHGPAAGGTPWPAELTQEVRGWAAGAHVAWLAASFLLPGLGVLGPLAVWLFLRERHAFIEEHAREALNFQLTITVANAALFVIAFVICFIGPFIAAAAALALMITSLVFSITAAVRAHEGKTYVYPASWRPVK